MARPQKHNVDYFPHYCDHGRILFILEKRWGNDGYAALYKLFELLGKANGHTLKIDDAESWEYFCAKMGVSGPVTQDIMQKLSEMGVIDAELWSFMIVWSQPFVDSLVAVYSKRDKLFPQKPQLPEKKPVLPEIKPTETPVSGVDNPHREEVKEVKKADWDKNFLLLVDEVKTKYPKFSIWPFLQTYKNYNHQALSHTLNQLLKYHQNGTPVKDPYPFCVKILAVENGNYNEREHTSRAEIEKAAEARDVAAMMAGIGKRPQ